MTRLKEYARTLINAHCYENKKNYLKMRCELCRIKPELKTEIAVELYKEEKVSLSKL